MADFKREGSDRPRNEGRNRSRSPPRRDRGGGGDRRGGYRNRSPYGRDGDRDRRDRGGRGGGRGDRRHDRDSRSTRGGPPTGPRGAPTGPRRDLRSDGPPAGPRAVASPEEPKDTKMEDKPKRERPEGMDDDTWEMAQVMGFARFKSTKQTKVPGNEKNYGIAREKKMEARQYMNRQGGFNRPLSPSRG